LGCHLALFFLSGLLSKVIFCVVLGDFFWGVLWVVFGRFICVSSVVLLGLSSGLSSGVAN
jgi:hypothetical protein